MRKKRSKYFYTGAIVRRLRSNRGFIQKDFANYLFKHTTGQMVSNLERGVVRFPLPEHIKRVRKLLSHSERVELMHAILTDFLYDLERVLIK